MNSKFIAAAAIGAVVLAGGFYFVRRSGAGAASPAAPQAPTVYWDAAAGMYRAIGSPPWQDQPGVNSSIQPYSPFGGIDIGQVLGTTKSLFDAAGSVASWFD